MRPEGPLQHSKHIVRAGLLLVIGVVALVLGRSLFVPDTWGQFGSYRGANVAEQTAKPVRHGGNESCEMCHSDEYEEVAGGVHASLACEACHAPLSMHIVDDDKVGDMPIRRSSELCLDCHQAMDARPASQPQINPKQHIVEQGGEVDKLDGPICLECHSPHEPL